MHQRGERQTRACVAAGRVAPDGLQQHARHTGTIHAIHARRGWAACKSRQRHGAAAAHGTRHGPLGRDRQPGRQVGQRAKGLQQIRPVSAYLDAQRTLPGGRQHVGGGKGAADTVCQPEPLEPGSGQHNRVVLPFIELAQARVEVAAQGFDFQIWPQGFKQHQPAQTGRAHHRALRQLAKCCKLVGHKSVMRVFTRQYTGQGKARGQIHGYILQGVHGDVGPTFGERHFKLFNKQSLAADLAQGAVQDLVAQRGHAQQRYLPAQTRFKQSLDMLGLPQRQAAFAGGNHYFFETLQGQFFSCFLDTLKHDHLSQFVRNLGGDANASMQDIEQEAPDGYFSAYEKRQ